MYTWVDHTGELELALEAGSERGVFVEAASGCCPVCFTRGRELDQIAEGEAHAAIDDWA